MQLPKIKALLLDLSGTLHIGSNATPRAVESLARLRAARIPFRFCSNTSKESKGSLIERLRMIGFEVHEHELFTSLSACREVVEERNLRPLLLLSPSALEDFSTLPHDPPHNAVLLGLAPEHLTYSSLNAAFRLLHNKRDIPLIATHKALYFADTDGELSLGPGPFVHALEQAAGVQAEAVGKPSLAFFEIVLKALEAEGVRREDWESVAVVGDDWRADLGGGAQELGLKRVLVKTGKFRQGDDDHAQADAVLYSFADLVDALVPNA